MPCLLLLLTLLAVEPPLDHQDTAPVPVLVVTATRTETSPFELPYHALPSDSLGEPGTTARTAVDGLRSPSVMLQRTSYGQTSPFLRGFTGFRTLLLVDGIRLNNAVFRDGPNQYSTLIDPLAVANAEVVFGPSSVLYGSDAIGGTLAFQMQSPELTAEGTRSGGRLYQRFASAEGSWVTRVEGQAAGERLAAHAGVSARQFGDLSAGRHQGLLENTGYDEQAVDAKLVGLLNAEWTWTLAVQLHRQLAVPRTHSTVFGQSYRGTTIGSDLRRDTDDERQLAYGRLVWEPEATRRVEATVYSTQLIEQENRVRSDGRRQIQDLADRGLGANLGWREQTPVGRLTAGIEWQLEDVTSDFRQIESGVVTVRRPRGAVADDSVVQTVAAYLEDQVQLGDRLELSLGTRFTYVGVDANEVDPDPSDADPVASVDESFDDLVGSLRLLHRTTERLHFYAGASQAFRAPNLSDLTRFDTARSGEVEVPAPGLDPERFVTLEFGAHWQSLRWRGQLAYYYTFIDGLIVRFPTGLTNGDGDPIVTKANAGDGFVHGVELSGEVQLERGFSLYGGFSWQESEVETLRASGDEIREPISRLAPATGTLGVQWQVPDTAVRLSADVKVAAEANRLSLSDEADTQRIPPGGTPAYTVFGLRGSYDPWPDFRVFLAIENLTDRDHRIHGSGVNEPGTNAIIGFDWRF